jgi:hypothetical protein
LFVLLFTFSPLHFSIFLFSPSLGRAPPTNLL